jgi:hypothetical protein
LGPLVRRVFLPVQWPRWVLCPLWLRSHQWLPWVPLVRWSR